MNRLIKCCFCNTHQFVSFPLNDYVIPHYKTKKEFPVLSPNKEVIGHKCDEYKCQKLFYIPIKYKLVYLARTFSVSDARYKYAYHVKDRFTGILDFMDADDFKEPKLENVVSFDKKLIDLCDILVAFINQPTLGTMGELYYTYYEKNMPIYIINHNRVHLGDPWLECISNNIYDDVDKCYQDIVDKTVKEYNLKGEIKL